MMEDVVWSGIQRVAGHIKYASRSIRFLEARARNDHEPEEQSCSFETSTLHSGGNGGFEWSQDTVRDMCRGVGMRWKTIRCARARGLSSSKLEAIDSRSIHFLEIP